ncbi:hypothetical protein FEM48_Zijuj01G0088000 [Ziziphus jujuba var. spinosa]|uniref:Nudix hydrolase domain-containing protein n=1 Tax=Ziziphus jujuba var. spinosa TaxID=714518 RepID=A0A978W0A2_ZIZJJ|nr:nudix hydrolase 2 [Ziziphus jujuba var. spinosa]KAH7545386.1 hypothetical protein FEM48_Zijuj01G0088000 [Ziziphus jujuba var. spinosa]
MGSLSVSANSSMAAEGVVVISGKEVQRPVEILSATNDEFDFVTVEMKEKMDPTIFASSLRDSVSHWRQQGMKAVWLKLPIDLVNLVPAAVDEGFSYHHAEPEYLMLACWLSQTKQVLPSYATNRVHIGAFVMNDKREVLVVKESRGMFKRMDLWKFPTGFAEDGEDISEAAKREVKEETGIDSEFVEILAFGHRHEQFHGKSNLFFVCMLRPLSFDIQMEESALKEPELEEAMWMPLEEFGAQPLVKELEVLNYMYAICKAKVDEGYSGFSRLPVSRFLDDVRESSFYFNAKDMKSKSLGKDFAEYFAFAKDFPKGVVKFGAKDFAKSLAKSFLKSFPVASTFPCSVSLSILAIFLYCNWYQSL